MILKINENGIHNQRKWHSKSTKMVLKINENAIKRQRKCHQKSMKMSLRINANGIQNQRKCQLTCADVLSVFVSFIDSTMT